MTKKEFIHRACISMAGKVIGTNGITNSDDWSNVVNEAEELAARVEEAGWKF